jgi:hypothetical protein
MRVKVFCVFALTLVLCGIFASFVRADDLENTLDEAGLSASQAQEYIDAQRWNFLSGEWKEFLLKNPFIQRFDSTMQKLNPIYIVLFARDYSLSLEMLLVFLLWLFTLLSIPGYLYFIEQEPLKWVAGLAGTVILAHLTIFNFLANVAVKIMFYKPVWYWSLIMFVVCIGLIATYLYLNRYLSGYLRAAREANKKRGLETKIKRIDAYQKSQSQAAGI